MKHYIYCITNLINQKKYVGQTNDLKRRWWQHNYLRRDKRNMYIDKAISKYGNKNFKYEILGETSSQEKADELERYYIKELKTMKPSGYNILKGGRKQHSAWNSKTLVVYDLQANFIGEYENSSYFESLFPEYLASGIRDCCTGKAKRYKDKIFKYKEDNIKVEPYINTKGSDKRKEVHQFDYEGNLIATYISVTEASKLTNTSRTSIIECCKGNYKQSNGYVWSYDKNPIIDSPQYHRMYIVKQIDKNGNIVNTFHNCKEAEEKLGFKKNTYKMIIKRLNQKKLYNGFYWEKEI